MTIPVEKSRNLVVALSGPVAGGKSNVAVELSKRFGAQVVSTREVLRRQAGPSASRSELQVLGRKLDEQTGGRWVVEGLRTLIAEIEAGPVVIDAIRTREQVEHLRELYGSRLRHLHVSAAFEVCAIRFQARQRELDRDTDYAAVAADPTEAGVRQLEGIADIVVHTDRLAANDSIVLAAAQLGLFDREHHACVDVVVGGSYGSEGKGNIAYYLAPEYDVLVRVGGPNAAHKVYPDGADKPFTHYSLPSGTMAGKAHLVLGPGAVVNPTELLTEIEASRVTPDRLSIDPRVMTIADEDQLREAALKEGIGSTASGTGAATARRLMRRSDVRLAIDAKELQPYVRPTFDVLESAYASGKRIMLEGTQGSGLSLFHGPYPYVTSRDTNVAGCLAEAGIPPARVRRTVLVVRTYPIRVAGNSGPITRELDWEEIERRSGQDGLAEKERTSRTGNVRRVGEPEWDLLRTSAVLNAPTDVALTFADYFRGNKEAWRYEQLSPESLEFIDQVERVTGARVSLISTGFMAHRGIIDRRQW